MLTTVFFGCNREAGHFLWRDDNDTMRDFEAERLGVPTPGQLDATRLFLPSPEIVGRGTITFLPASHVTVLAWWGSPYDKRGKVNSAIIVGGHVKSLEAIWAAFTKQFPRLASNLSPPTIVGEL